MISVLIAAFVAYIGLEQWRTARNNYKLALFDRRLHIYDAVKGVLAKLTNGGKIDEKEMFALLEKTSGAKWLFDDRVAECLREFELKIRRLGVTIVDEPETYWIASADAMAWVRAQYEEMDSLFGEFLQVDRSRFSEIKNAVRLTYKWIRTGWGNVTSRQ